MVAIRAGGRPGRESPDRADRDSQEVDVSKLVIFRGDAVETEMHLGAGAIRIGRDERNTIVLNDKSVSRFHAEVRQEGGAYYVVDLKSRNGIYVNGHQIKGKAALSLGVPVTLGAYELALEDDLSTSEFGGDAPQQGAGHTVVSTSVSERAARSNQAGTQRMQAAKPPTSKSASPPAAALVKRPAAFWAVLGGGTLVLCLITFFVVRAIVRRPPPPPEEAVALATTTIAPEPPANPNKDVIDQHVLAARDALERRDFDAVLTEAAAVVELDPTNQEAADLRRQAEEGKAATPPVPTSSTPKPPKPPKEEPIQEVSGIPKRTTETQPDYDARVLRIKTNYGDGVRSIERQEFSAGIAKFEAVKRDQPGYQEIDTLIAEAHDKQRKAVDDAIAQGQKSEQEGKYGDARRWYERARGIDASATSARDRLIALQEKTAKAGMDAYNEAGVYRKRSLNARAIELYKLAVD